MAQTFTKLLAHIIFSTKDRAPCIALALRPDLFAYLGGIVRGLQGKALAVNGTSDHVHMLASLPPTRCVSEVVRDVKANSSHWVRQKKGQHTFSWQAGYGAFSVSQSNVDDVMRYIASQEEHHRRVTFQEEFLAFLKKYGIDYDNRYIWQ
ncbi:MAG TPA: IS200/IS605 family transposase [Terriglobia bacterium]|nr:IS200/IS605 family transposase [Terriglobia bacterium]